MIPLVALGLASASFSLLKEELTAKRAWAGIGALVLGYEMIAPPGELLSEGVDAALSLHPNLTRLAIGVTALHLMNALPERIDPYRIINLTREYKRGV